MARASAVKMPPEANAAHGCEGARRVLALMLTVSAGRAGPRGRHVAREEDRPGRPAGLRDQRGRDPPGCLGGRRPGHARQADGGGPHRALPAGPGARRAAGTAPEPGQELGPRHRERPAPGPALRSAVKTVTSSAGSSVLTVITVILPACRNFAT